MQHIVLWFIVSSFLGGAAIALVGVVIGAFAVFRTKRESYDSFFTSGHNSGDAFNVDDGFEQEAVTKSELPQATEAANDSFVQQFVDSLAKKAGK